MQIELPGLFDLQVNGFAGVDFNNPKATDADILRAVRHLESTGVTAFLPTLITSPLETFKQCAKTILSQAHDAIVGLHMEGPYISGEDGPRGAHSREFVIPASVDDFSRRQELAGGKILLVTLAPEAPGAIELIEFLVQQGIRVAIGHTAASAEQISDAVKAGATLSTHLGNGCHLQLPRHPNLIWEQLADDKLIATLIIDGHHLPAATAKCMIRSKGPNQVILITDAMAAAGCGPGCYELGGESVVVDNAGRVSQPGKPWLAGSALTLDQAVVNTVKLTGMPLETVWQMASVQPAKYLGLEPVGRVLADWDNVNCRLSNLKMACPQVV